MGGETAEEMEERLKQSGQTAREKARMFIQKSRRFGVKADDYAHEHPWTVMAAGLAIGFVLAVLSNKPKRCD